MKMIFKAVIAAVFVLNSFYINGQDTIRLSLDSAVNHALQYNITLANARYSIQKSRAATWEMAATGLPQVDADISYNNFMGATAELKLSENAPAAEIKFNPTSNLSLNATQLIFSGNYIVGLQLAKLASKISNINYQRTEIDVKEQVISSYFLVLVSERYLNIIKSNKNNTQLLYEKTKNLADAGIIEKTEADKLLIMVTSIENAQKASERQLELAYNMLRLQLGLQPKENIKLITSLDEVSGQNRFETALLNSFSINNNFDYKLISMYEEVSQKQLNLQRSKYLPTVVGFYSRTEKLLKPLFDMTPKNVIGLSMSVPIFSSGQRVAQVKQAKIDLLIIENNKGLLAQQLEIQEKQYRYNLNNLLEQYNNQKKNIDISKEVYDKMSLKFQQGIVSSLELTSANSSYLAAESDFTSILFQLLDAEIALKKLNGNL